MHDATRMMTACQEKLDNCEVCAVNKAKYTCPKCEVRTCSLTCSTIHKKELNCDGIRDKTKYLPIQSITESDLISDYCLLQEAGRTVDKCHKDPLRHLDRKYNIFPLFLRKLRGAAFKRGITLKFMPRSFSRNKQNTTYLNWRRNELLWRIDWIFPQADNIKWSTQKASEKARLSRLLENVLDPEMKTGEDEEVLNLKFILKNKLKFYRAAGLSGVKVLLKAEKVKKSDCSFYELDLTLSLSENLQGKTIIEYPTIYVILSSNSDTYEIIETDDEETIEVNRNKNYRFRHKSKGNGRIYPINDISKENESGIQIEEKEAKIDPINFLFHTEFSDSEDEKTKAEQNKNVKLQQRKRKFTRNQRRIIFKKIEKVKGSVNEFTGICKSNLEDEMKKNHDTVISSTQNNSQVVSLNGNSLVKENLLNNYLPDFHITDSEDEGPEEQVIQRLGSFEDEEMQTIKNSNENSVENDKSNEKVISDKSEMSSAAIKTIAMNYFSAYMTDSEDETVSDTQNIEKSGLSIPDHNEIVKMKN